MPHKTPRPLQQQDLLTSLPAQAQLAVERMGKGVGLPGHVLLPLLPNWMSAEGEGERQGLRQMTEPLLIQLAVERTGKPGGPHGQAPPPLLPNLLNVQAVKWRG